MVLIIWSMITQPVYAHGDRPSDWAEKAIHIITTSEVIDMNRFHFFERPITREEYAYIIYQLYEYLAAEPISEIADLTVDSNFSDLTTGREATQDGHGQSFTDTDNLYIRSLKSAGLIQGHPNGTFKPNAPITRQEIMVLYSRLLEKLGYTMTVSDKVFKDQSHISPWAEEGVRKCYASGLIQGEGEGRINPQGEASVQESLVVLARILSHETYVPAGKVALQSGSIVSNGLRTYGVRYSVLGEAIGIDAYEDYTKIGTVYSGRLQKDDLILDGGNLYFTDGDGEVRRFDGGIHLAENPPKVTEATRNQGLKTKVFEVTEDGHLLGKDKATGAIVDYGHVDALKVRARWNYLILEVEAVNGAPIKRFLPIVALKDYLGKP